MAKLTKTKRALAEELANKFCRMDAAQQAVFIERIHQNTLEWCGDPEEAQWPEVRKRLALDSVMFFRKIAG